MIAAFSTSSPWTSVSVMRETGEVVWSDQRHAPGKSSGACMEMLEASGVPLEEVRVFAADVGPGSFTGVRVGVVLAKTLAWCFGVRCAGADAFDLIDPSELVALPSKKGEYFLREPGSAPERTEVLPEGVLGYGFEGGSCPPHSERFSKLLSGLVTVAPMQFIPAYLIEPSISQAKKPLSRITG